MVVKIRAKSQLTLPNKTIKKLGISEGDEYEVVEREDGSILLVPVVTCPKAYIDNLEKEVEKARLEIKNGNRPVFTSVDDMLEYMEKN